MSLTWWSMMPATGLLPPEPPETLGGGPGVVSRTMRPPPGPPESPWMSTTSRKRYSSGTLMLRW